MSDEFSEMMEPDDGGAPKKAAPTMVIRGPCLNSCEIELLEMMREYETLTADDHDIEFIGPDDEAVPPSSAEIEAVVKRRAHFGLPPEGMPNTPEIKNARERMIGMYHEHIAIARSCGRDTYWPEYYAACKRENITPIRKRT